MQFLIALADFAHKGSAMLTQALHLVLTTDAKALFVVDHNLLMSDKNMFHTILTEIFPHFFPGLHPTCLQLRLMSTFCALCGTASLTPS
jgi:hypothetical protein